MINFYKQDGIGKIAFNDGNIYVPQGNVTLLLDTTTEKIIVAEDERLIYWISLSQPLEVNGSQISGTDAEKLALIAPVFQNEGGSGGTGGASARFGVSGEDITSDVDRYMDMQGHEMIIDYASDYYFTTLTGGSILSVAPTLFTIRGGKVQVAGEEDSKGLGENVAYIIAQGESFRYSLEVGANNGVRVVKTDVATNTPVTHPVPLSVSANGGSKVFADSTGNITLLPDQSFDSNSEAVAALGVGMLYKSTTLINGSPIILITV